MQAHERSLVEQTLVAFSSFCIKTAIARRVTITRNTERRKLEENIRGIPVSDSPSGRLTSPLTDKYRVFLGWLETAGVAAFLAMETLSHHEKKEGKKPIGMTKKLLVSLVAAEVDKLVEEKAIPAAEAHRYKKEAERKAHAMADERYSESEEAY
ncbi:cipC-like antibiotic response protein [Sanghuangporus baumii]|uniref:CipC-like antibiotic response protein n=1 Tax=Sanghuangporus baumii TaxID=108892 RepID=A0A9Q5HTU5_SANBA|nr:cipC-like antibiotic response protein [Sanghuangporus baumii]